MKGVGLLWIFLSTSSKPGSPISTVGSFFDVGDWEDERPVIGIDLSLIAFEPGCIQNGQPLVPWEGVLLVAVHTGAESDGESVLL